MVTRCFGRLMLIASIVFASTHLSIHAQDSTEQRQDVAKIKKHHLDILPSDMKFQEKMDPKLSLNKQALKLSQTRGVATMVSAAIKAPFEFNAVGPHWKATLPTGGSLKVEIRTSIDGKSWSEWQSVHEPEEAPMLTESGEQNPYGGDMVGPLVFANPKSRFVQYRLTLTSAPSGSVELKRISLYFINTTAGPEQPKKPEGLKESMQKQQGVLVVGYPKPRIYLRAEWGARTPSGSYTINSPVTHLAIHHSASATDYNSTSWTTCTANIRAHQSYHMDVNGWIDIGYNYLVCKHGDIFQGREDDNDASDIRGAHDGINTASAGTCALGYFHSPENNVPSPDLINSLAHLFAWIADIRGINPQGTGTYSTFPNLGTIYGHREVRATACPGDLLFAEKQRMKDSTSAKLDRYTPPASPVLASPANGSTNQPDPVALSWSAAARATSYTVQVSTSSSFSTTAINQSGFTITSYNAAGLQGNTTYYWRVNATNAGGTSSWSTVWSFTTGARSIMTVLADFEASVGVFDKSPTYSGSTVGIATTSTSARTTSVSRTGVGSLAVVLKDNTSSASNWTVRLLSGSGSPTNNQTLSANGYIGFWMKTSTARAGSQIAVTIDDGAGGTELSSKQNVINDGAWHLYQWQLKGASWTNFAGGNGVIDGSTVTLDALMFYSPNGAADWSFNIDDVSHNDTNPLLAESGENPPTTRPLEGPTTFWLAQNFPNPFNPSTEIEFSVTTDGLAKLTVHDILGREVGVLFDDFARAGYRYRKTFNATGLATGTYFYVLHAYGQREVKRMMLVK